MPPEACVALALTDDAGRCYGVCVLGRGTQIMLTVDQRQALRLLDLSVNGCTQSMLLARGLAIGMLRGLVRDGLATADRERAPAGRGTVIITRLRITDAGRKALAR